jgi:polyisoprenoid-binding protein YceI
MMRPTLIVLCFLAAAPAFAQDTSTVDAPVPAVEPWLAPPGVYELDPDATTVTMTANRFLMSPVRAEFGTVEGRLTVTVDTPDASVLLVEIASGDLSANGPIVENMLTGRAFLNADAFPAIIFTMDGFTVSNAPVDLAGDLAMAGVTHPASFATQLEDHTLDEGTGTLRLHFVSEGELDRRDWSMTGYRGMVSDTVRIRIEAAFVQLPRSAGTPGSEVSPAD